MTSSRLLLALLLTAACPQAAFPAAPDAAQQQSIRRLQESLLAPCCWTEPVSVHRSETAAEMRVEIEKAVLSGKSEREIIDHYKAIHGARILIEPEGSQGVWVYLVPGLAATAGLLLVVFVIRRLLGAQPAGQPAL